MGTRSASVSTSAAMEDDDDAPRRSTRGRNPLPPTTGPLFPPLPPKQPKSSSKPPSKPQSLASSTTSKAQQSETKPIILHVNGNGGGAGAKDVTPPPSSPSGSGTNPKPDLPSGSIASLTPPPPTSDDPNLEAADPGIEGEEGSSGMAGSEDWENYRQHRAIRGFGAAQSVKEEDPSNAGDEDVDEEGENTPRRAGGVNGKRRPSSIRIVSGDSFDQGEGSEHGGSGSGRSARNLSRKRRGEEQLLLDDHLLPAEMRRTGVLAGKRGQPSSSRVKEEDDDEEDEAEEEEQADENEDIQVDPENAVENGDEEVPQDDTAVDVSDTERTPRARRVKPDRNDVVASNGDEEEEADEAVAEDDGEEGEEGDAADITRCVCKSEDTDVMMIQCDNCNVWQHGPCMGIWADEEAPDEYFCEECKPELHGPLRRWLRSKGRNYALNFLPPTPEDLLKYHNSHDKYPPTQSKRWSEPDLADTPQKPVSKSRAKDSVSVSPVAEVRGRPGASKSEKNAVASSSRHDPYGQRKSESGTHRRRVSLGGVKSPSPRDSESPHPQSHGPPKRRSTMNSRDAAYEEEQFKAVLEASRREMLGLRGSPGHHPRDASMDRKRRRGDDDDDESVATDRPASRKGKRKKEDDGNDDPPVPPIPAHLKSKHPNQYTYRPKPPSSATERVSTPHERSTPVPSLPPPAQHDHGTRRAGAIANGIIPPPPNSISVHNLHWHLPDHLSPYSDLLQSEKPIALESRATRQLTNLSRNHFNNQKYGPFTEERDPESKDLVLPEEPVVREPVGDPVTQLEPPARVRYPAKRITTAEMKKRARGMLEYISRIKTEEEKRKERAEFIGILSSTQLPDVTRLDKDGEALMEDDTTHHSRRWTEGPSIAEMMEDLNKDLTQFLDTFASGGFATPLPTSSQPVTPVIPSHAEGEADATDTAVNQSVEQSAPMEDTHAVQVEEEHNETTIEQGEVEEDGAPINTEMKPENGDVDIVMEDQNVSHSAIQQEPAEEKVEVYRAGPVDQVVADTQEVETAKVVEEVTAGDETAN